jgi:hypothetical protein
MEEHGRRQTSLVFGFRVLVCGRERNDRARSRFGSIVAINTPSIGAGFDVGNPQPQSFDGTLLTTFRIDHNVVAA